MHFIYVSTSAKIKDKKKFLEEILNSISKEIGYKLIPLNNLTDQEATKLTGLKGHSLNLMRDRHWSMPFLNPPSYLEEIINICVKNSMLIFLRVIE